MPTRESEAPPGAVAGAAAVTPLSVLLVHDAPKLGDTVRRLLLGRPELELTAFSDGAAALALARSLDPERARVLLLDLHLPLAEDGLQFLRALREDEQTAELPVVTLARDGSTAAAAFQAGADDCLLRLPDAVELAARLQHHARSYERRRQAAALARRERQVLAANRSLEQASAAKSRFLASMSHEIRTPLNAVIGMTGLLLETQLTEEQRECAETARNAGQSLLTVINDILDFSKIEAGRMELDELDFDLRATVEEVAELLADQAERRSTDLVVLMPPELPAMVRGDPGRLRQVLMNLLSNAVKFTEGGQVVLRVTHPPGDGCHLRFAVSDSGIGIDPESQARLFQAFTQASPRIGYRYGGTGLGLVICRQIVELMGGEIGVQSRPGRGSTFWFTVRLGTSERQQPPRRFDPEVLRGRSALCLVRNALMLERLCLDLVSSGVIVHAYSDVERAFEALPRVAPDLLLIDAGGLGEAAWDAVRRARADRQRNELPILLLTTVGMRGDVHDARRAGVNAYLTKPLRRDQLLEAMARVIDSAAGYSTEIVTRHSVREARRLRGKVLVVEDNAVNQRVLEKMLERCGLRADLASSGTEALQATGQVDYDLILMDYRMPDMTGLEAARRIREREQLTGARRATIIATTADADLATREECLGGGMDDFVPKPIDYARLVEVLGSHLEAQPT